MKVSIIVPDNTVIVDGVAKRNLDLSFMDGVHAVQWYDTWGDVERIDAHRRHTNETIDSLAPYQPAIDAWNAAPSGE